jgi:chromosomal replication initiation ATPase DnaA
MIRPDIAGRIAKIGATRLLDRVASEHGVTPSSILGPRQTRSVVRARNRFLFLLWSTFGYSHTELGDMLDRDHSTVTHALNKEERLARERLGL